jgi:membrane protease YdiL (CAAX protease family)
MYYDERPSAMPPPGTFPILTRLLRRRSDSPQASRRKRDRQRNLAPFRNAGASIQASGQSQSSGELRPLEDAKASPGLWPVAAICATACLGLLMMEFGGSEPTFASLFPPPAHGFDPYWVLRVRAWWVGSILIGFLALPSLLMFCLPGNRLRDCNLSFRGFREHFWIYVGLYGAVLPVIWIVSLSSSFYMFYPMYGQAGRSWLDLLMWEGMYAGQFVALEFFFRGFLVGGLSRYIGIFAVPVSVIPYMMIHFTKPLPEAAASVVAGFVLGYLAWKTKSIWGGVCVHCGVAATMDILALAHKGQLPWLHT